MQVQVDPVAVERLAEQLGGVTAVLVEAAAALGGTGGAVGDDLRLAAALDEMADAWRTGLSRLADEAVATAAALRGGAQGYRHVDGAVARACG